MRLKFYSCTFTGFYPVGACAIVHATGYADTDKRMRDALREEGLDPDQHLEFNEIDTRTAGAVIILNGDY